MFQVRLLGQFDVRADGKRVLIPSRSGQSLFAYLALNARAEHRREKLAGMIWPDTSDEIARKNLRQELWRIRKAITTQSPPDGDALMADEFLIAFRPAENFWLDVEQLERASDEMDALLNVVALYRGELLPGFYDEWVILERDRVQALFEGRAGQLLELLTQAQQWKQAQEWAERWIALGQTPEPAYRALMLAAAAQGDSAKLALAYERCVEALRNDVGVEPSAETRTLFQELSRGEKPAPQILKPLSPVLIQPSGTVTFLFSDIEGSTKLLERLGSEYANLLADQRDVLRAIAEKHNGHEVDTQGDSFFFAFFRAADAVTFAADAQRALTTHPWPRGERLRVRMGLHTGEPMLARTGYVGMDVHRAARIGAAGHGGQVLLSQTTSALVENELPDGTRLDDLGEHRLKDLRYPVHIIQLTIDDLPSDFPPIKTFNTAAEPPAPGEPPFKGLEFFDEADAGLFFGREQLVEKLLQTIHAQNFLAVVIGASGSGKSSVVRAGLIPALRGSGDRGQGTGSGQGTGDGGQGTDERKAWRVFVMTPTAHPLEALATTLTRDSESVTATATLFDDLARDPRSLQLYLRRHTANRESPIANRESSFAISDTRYAIRALLVVDQFEELFTLCRDDFEREQFIDCLLDAISVSANGGGSRSQVLTLVLTIRADFYSHLAQYPELRDAVAKQQEYIGPMNVEELRRAMEEPATRGGWTFEPGLVDLILRDVGEEPGALPLLSHALLETWKRRSGHTMTLKGYADSGGVRGAIAHTAETTYQQLAPEQQTIARNIFLRLTELGQGTEDTRRRAEIRELEIGDLNREQVRQVLTMLADARLITTNENTAEVAHEALIREWPRLRAWLNEDREGLQLHRHLTEAAHEWELMERDASVLYRGARLAQVSTNWERINELNASERAFLEASEENEKRETREREEQQRRELEQAQSLALEQQARAEESNRANKRLRQRAVFLAGVVVLALLAAGAAFFFLTQSNANLQTANEQRAEASAQRDVAQKAEAQAEKEKRFALARELAANATTSLEQDPERSILLALQAVATTRDIDKIVLPEAEGALHHAVMTSRILHSWTNPDGIPSKVVFAPDGKTFAVNGTDGKIRLVDLASGKELMSLPIEREYWSNMYFSPDGKRLATADYPGLNSVSAKVFDLETGQLIKETPVGVAFDNAYFGSFNPDWTRVAFGQFDGKVTIWDFETGELLQTLAAHEGLAQQVVYSPNGTKILTIGQGDRLATLWDASTGTELRSWESPIGNFFEIAFSSDGKKIGASGLDKTATVWDAETGEELLKLEGHNDWVTSIGFSADGSRIATNSYDRTARIWDGVTGKELMILRGHNGFVRRGAISPDGTRLVTTGLDQTMKIWDLTPSHEDVTIPVPNSAINNFGTGTMRYSPQGDRLAAGFQDGSVVLWDTANWKEVIKFVASKEHVWRIVFSPDGTRLVSSGLDKTAKIWDLKTGKELLTFREHKGGINALAYSPDGKYIATGDQINVSQIGIEVGQTIKVWDANSGQVIWNFPVEGIVNNLDFSPDGTRLLSSYPDEINNEYNITNWDLASGKPVFTRILDTPFWVHVKFSPDGSRWVASADAPGTHIYDSNTGQEIVTLGDVKTPTDYATFNHDGTLVATQTFAKGVVNVWDAATGKELLALHQEGTVNSVEFSPDGTRLAVASWTEIRLYLTRVEDLVALAKTRVTRSLTPEECSKYLHVEKCPE